jgi:hypothetical protein
MNTPKELKAKFPYMFLGENIGLAFHRGWFPTFVSLCEQIDEVLGEDKRGFHWEQLKEKFGAARYYWSMKSLKRTLYIDLIAPDRVTTLVNQPKSRAEPSSSQVQRINELVQQAEQATSALCIVCRQPGTLNQDQPWMLVLCPRHAGQRRRGKMEPHWFPEEEQ